MTNKQTLLRLEAIAGIIDPPEAGRALVLRAVSQNLYAAFFYARTASTAWVEPSLLQIESAKLDELGVWHRLQYLLRVLANEPAMLVPALSRIRPWLTGRMLYDVVKALLLQPPEIAWDLRGLVADFVKQKTRIIATDLGAYIFHVSKAGNLIPSQLWDLVAAIISFVPDAEQEDKQAKEAQNPDDWSIRLRPKPRFDAWEFQQILEKGVRPLARKFPLQSARVLSNAVASYLEMRFPNAQVFEGVRQDLSAVWCERLDVAVSGYMDVDQALVHTFTYACEQVFVQAPANSEELEELNTILLSYRWSVFDRLRFYLFGKHPARSAKWIVCSLKEYAHYSDIPYDLEFAGMIFAATREFGEALLSRGDRERIFAEILSGPGKEDYRAVHGDEVTAIHFDAYQRHFWIKQFTPFEPVLFGRYREDFLELSKTEAKVEPDAYAKFTSHGVHSVESRSPKAVQDLGGMPDLELIQFINTWVEEQRKDLWVEVNFEGLASAFGQLVRKTPDRFASFGAKWRLIVRPIFIRFAVDAGKDEIKEGNLIHLGAWLDLCDWIADHENRRHLSRKELREESGDAPDWEQARKTAVDFLGICLTAKAKVPLDWRNVLASIIAKLNTGYDMWLDRGESITTPADPLTDAINTTRGRAIELLFQFTQWISTNDAGRKDLDAARELRAVLEQRFEGNPPLVLAERVQLARNIPFSAYLDYAWTERIVDRILSKPGGKFWRDSFATFTMYAQPNREILPLLRKHYAYAVTHPGKWPGSGRTNRDFLPRLGQHLFLYYVWGLESLTARESLLAQYYEHTKPPVWSLLMQYIGVSLKKNTSLEPALKERCIGLFDFRLSVGNAIELASFDQWLDAECLDAEWRLRSLIAILNGAGKKIKMSMLVTANLGKMLPSHTDLVVEAFSKLISFEAIGPGFYFDAAEVVPVLKAGLASPNESTRGFAAKAQEKLLKAGMFDYLHVND